MDLIVYLFIWMKQSGADILQYYWTPLCSASVTVCEPVLHNFDLRTYSKPYWTNHSTQKNMCHLSVETLCICLVLIATITIIDQDSRNVIRDLVRSFIGFDKD